MALARNYRCISAIAHTWDLYTANATEQRAEVDRLTSLWRGAGARLDIPEGADFRRTPRHEGNLFCVVDHS